MRLETSRLVLRPLVEEDAPFLVRLLNQPSWLRFIGDKGVRTVADAERYVRTGPMEMQRQFGYGLHLVARKPDGVPVGICGLVRREWLAGPDLGFAVLDEYAGAGYAREASEAILAKAVGLQITRVLAIVTPDNARSVRVLARLGFASEGMVVSPTGETLRLFGLSLVSRANAPEGAAAP